MNEQYVEIMARAYPKQFRGPQFTHTRNNVYEWVTNDSGRTVRQLVGQLEDVGPMRLPASEAAPLFGQTVAGVLTAVGAISSVANLGVSIAGFAMMKRDFNRVFRRLDAIQNVVEGVSDKVDTALESLELLHLKVDYLVQVAQLQQADVEIIRNTVEDIRQFQLDRQRVEIESALEDLAYLMEKGHASDAHAFQAVAERLRIPRKQILLLVDRCEEAHPVNAEMSVLATLVATAEAHAWYGASRIEAGHRAIAEAHSSISRLFERGYSEVEGSFSNSFTRQAALFQRRFQCTWDEACVGVGESNVRRITHCVHGLRRAEEELSDVEYRIERSAQELAVKAELMYNPLGILIGYGASSEQKERLPELLRKFLAAEIDKAGEQVGRARHIIQGTRQSTFAPPPSTMLALVEQTGECLRCLESARTSFATRHLIEHKENIGLLTGDEGAVVFELMSKPATEA